MKQVLALALVFFSQPAFASKLVNQDMRQYLPSFGLGSTQSVSYTATSASTARIANTSGAATELVSIMASTDAYIVQNASGLIASDNTQLYLPAKTPMLLEILSGNRFAAINAGATSGNLFVTHLITFPTSN